MMCFHMFEAVLWSLKHLLETGHIPVVVAVGHVEVAVHCIVKGHGLLVARWGALRLRLHVALHDL